MTVPGLTPGHSLCGYASVVSFQPCFMPHSQSWRAQCCLSESAWLPASSRVRPVQDGAGRSPATGRPRQRAPARGALSARAPIGAKPSSDPEASSGVATMSPSRDLSIARESRGRGVNTLWQQNEGCSVEQLILWRSQCMSFSDRCGSHVARILQQFSVDLKGGIEPRWSTKTEEP